MAAKRFERVKPVILPPAPAPASKPEPKPERKFIIVPPKESKKALEKAAKPVMRYQRRVVWLCYEHGLCFTDTDEVAPDGHGYRMPIVCPECEREMVIIFDTAKGEENDRFKWDGKYLYKKALCAAGEHLIWVPYADGQWQYDMCPECL